MVAILDEKFEILKVLLNCRQLNLNQNDSKGNSPVMKAIKKDCHGHADDQVHKGGSEDQGQKWVLPTEDRKVGRKF